MRWYAVIFYRTNIGPIGVEHDFEELHDLVERGPDWRAIEYIRVTLQRFDQILTIEEARQL